MKGPVPIITMVLVLAIAEVVLGFSWGHLHHFKSESDVKGDLDHSREVYESEIETRSRQMPMGVAYEDENQDPPAENLDFSDLINDPDVRVMIDTVIKEEFELEK